MHPFFVGRHEDYVEGRKPPEPLFFRAANNDVIEYWHTNLVPAYYELDDLEVRTPTDILGQHIHLVKFDVMASDGAANGYNYEDGTFSPEEVRERIDSINQTGGLWDAAHKHRRMLKPKSIKEVGDGPAPGKAWVGAQATVQRWWLDPLMNQPAPGTCLAAGAGISGFVWPCPHLPLDSDPLRSGDATVLPRPSAAPASIRTGA